MKILVFSDSHTDTMTMCDVTRKEQPDMLLHLGDHSKDAIMLAAAFPSIPLRGVRGNTDLTGEDILEECILGKRLFLTHGHLYGVKNGLHDLREAGIQKQADIVLFGHTHRPHLDCFGGCFLMNPGSISLRIRNARPASYGVICIEEGNITCDILEL